MAVIPLTLTISLCLVFTFVVFFLREQSRPHFASAESDALLPLAVETPRAARPASADVVPAGAAAPATPALHGAAHVCHRKGSCDSCVRRAAHAHARAQTAAQTLPSAVSNA